MRIHEVIDHLQQLAPLSYAEDFDNVGLLVGDKNLEVTGIIVALDTLEEVLDEAIANKCNLIVSFHPIIFNGLKKLTGSNYVERVVIKAVQHQIAIFSIHTALDNSIEGVNAKICDKLGLDERSILLPKKGTIKKLQTYVPQNFAEVLRVALFEAGAGSIGNYDQCSFNQEGLGTYRGNENSNPVIGVKGRLQQEKETAISVTYAHYKEEKILAALYKAHPYEEVAYEVTTLDNYNQNIGMGMVGKLPKPMSEIDFLSFVKKTMKSSCIRHSTLLDKPVNRVAVLGGSGSFAIDAAKAAGADIFITADLKYHDFFKAENSIVLADVGHYESEQFTKSLIVDYLSKKITNFAIILSKTNTNPVKYL